MASTPTLDSDMQVLLDRLAAYQAPAITDVCPRIARLLPSLANAAQDLNAEHVAARLKAVAAPMPTPVGAIVHALIPGPESELVARIYMPAGDGPFPVVVYFHGGGWVIANLDTYDSSCRALTVGGPFVVISVGYRQAPEHRFPAPVHDAVAALTWARAHAASYKGDVNRIAVAGESAGGNLATTACLVLRDRHLPLPIFQLLVYPVTNHAFDTPSYRENAQAKPLNAAMMPWFWNHYLGEHGDGDSPLASPLRAPDLSGLPPALIITAQFDPLRDEGEAYGARLQRAGVSTRVVRYDGVSHEFFGLAGMVAQGKKAVAEAVGALNHAFTGAAADQPQYEVVHS